MKANEKMLLAVLSVWVLTRKRVVWPEDGWVWPVASLHIRNRVYRPVITSHYGDMRAKGPHNGMDIAFARRDPQDLVDMFPPGTPNGGKTWIAPPLVPVVAARAGKVWSVQKTERGWSVVLNHGTPWATYYQHLETVSLPLHKRGVNVNTGQPSHVSSGDVLGIMGWDPTDPQRARHLHFEVWNEGNTDSSIDAGQAMRGWSHPTLVRTIT